MTIDLWTAVREWNDAVGVPNREYGGWPSNNDLALAVRLVEEELGELQAAFGERDLVAVADALADGLFVLAGLALRCGVARTYIREYLPGESDIRSGHPVPCEAALESLFEYSWPDLLAAVESRNLNRLDAMVHACMFHLAEVARWLRLPLDAIFAEVVRSNRSKLVNGKIQRRQDGKILKGPDYSPPDIAGVLRAHGWEEAPDACS